MGKTYRATVARFLPLSALLFLPAALSCLGCHGPSGNDPEPRRGHRILDFTLLGDSALALRFETWEVRNPPDSAPWPQPGFALFDRKTGTLRPLDSLPVSAAPTFPSWFFTCDSGRPASVHPPGYIGPAGACATSRAPAISPEGYAVAFADSQARVNLLSRELEPITFRATGADSAMPLEYASGVGRVFILEWHGRGDSVLWRGFANDDPSGSDSGWLVRPGRVRVHGAGTRLICGDADLGKDSLAACWRPEGTPGLPQAVREAEGGNPEWSPATGELAYLVPPARIVFRILPEGRRHALDLGPALMEFRP
jgi:hypothetical protein